MAVLGWVTFILLLAIVLALGIFNSKKVRNLDSYLLADRKTKLFALVATLVMTEFNTATLISFSSAGLYAQWWALTLPLVFLIGLLFYSLTVAKKWKSFNGVCVTDFFASRYNNSLAKLACCILFIAMAGFSATYIKSITVIFSLLFPEFSNWLLSGVLLIIAFIMTWRGGLLSIIRTDLISFIIIMLFFPVLLFFAYQLPISSKIDLVSLQHMQQALPPSFVASLVLLTMFSYIIAPWYGQKVISADSPRTAVLAVMIAAILVFMLYSLGVLATWQLSRKGISLASSEHALPYLIEHALPAGLQGIAYGTLFITTATTLSGVWSAMVTLLIQNHKQQTRQSHLQDGLKLNGLCCILTYILANVFIDKIFNKMILLNIPIVALSFALLAGFYWKKATITGAYISIIVGLVWGSGCYLYYGEENMYTWYWAVYGIPLIFISGIAGSLIRIKQLKTMIFQSSL